MTVRSVKNIYGTASTAIIRGLKFGLNRGGLSESAYQWISDVAIRYGFRPLIANLGSLLGFTSFILEGAGGVHDIPEPI